MNTFLASIQSGSKFNLRGSKKVNFFYSRNPDDTKSGSLIIRINFTEIFVRILKIPHYVINFSFVQISILLNSSSGNIIACSALKEYSSSTARRAAVGA